MSPTGHRSCVRPPCSVRYAVLLPTATGVPDFSDSDSPPARNCCSITRDSSPALAPDRRSPVRTLRTCPSVACELPELEATYPSGTYDGRRKPTGTVIGPEPPTEALPLAVPELEPLGPGVLTSRAPRGGSNVNR